MNTQSVSKFQRFNNLETIARDKERPIAERKKAYRDLFGLAALDARLPHGDAPSEILPEFWTRRIGEIEKLLEINVSKPLHQR